MPFYTIQKGWNVVKPDSSVSMRCPSCKKVGVFDVLTNVINVKLADGAILGLRYCPNADCNTVIVMIHRDRKLLVSYPPER